MSDNKNPGPPRPEAIDPAKVQQPSPEALKQQSKNGNLPHRPVAVDPAKIQKPPVAAKIAAAAKLLLIAALLLFSGSGHATTTFLLTNDYAQPYTATFFSTNSNGRYFLFTTQTNIATNTIGTITDTNVWPGLAVLNGNNTRIFGQWIGKLANTNGGKISQLFTNVFELPPVINPSATPAAVSNVPPPISSVATASVIRGTNAPNALVTAGAGSLYNQFDGTGTNFVQQWVNQWAGSNGWQIVTGFNATNITHAVNADVAVNAGNVTAATLTNAVNTPSGLVVSNANGTVGVSSTNVSTPNIQLQPVAGGGIYSPTGNQTNLLIGEDGTMYAVQGSHIGNYFVTPSGYFHWIQNNQSLNDSAGNLYSANGTKIFDTNGNATSLNLITPTGYDITRANIVGTHNTISTMIPLDTWVVLGAYYNEAKVLGWMTNMITAGYPTNFSYAILLDESWLGGHSGGVPYMNLTNFPDGFSYLTTNLHNNGFGIEYFLTLGTNGVAGPGSAGYEFGDAAWLTTNGADGLYLVDDAEQYTASGIPANRYWLAVNGSRSTGRYIPIMGTTYIMGMGSARNSFDARFISELGDGQNMVFPTYSDGLGDTFAMVDSIYWWDKYKYLIYPGHRLMHGWMGTGFDATGAANQWVTRAQWGVVAMYHGKFSWAIPQSPVNPPSYGWEMITNQFLTNVDNDVSFTVPTVFYGTLMTNSLTAVNTATNTVGLVETLHDGTVVFGVWNQATNTVCTNTISVNFTNALPPYGTGLGLAGGDYTVTNGWTMAASDCPSNQLNITVPPEGFQWFSLTPNTGVASQSYVQNALAGNTNLPTLSITNFGNAFNIYVSPSNCVLQFSMPVNGIEKMTFWTNGSVTYGNAVSSALPHDYETATWDLTMLPYSTAYYFDKGDWLDCSSNNWARFVINNSTALFVGAGGVTNNHPVYAPSFTGSGLGLTNLLPAGLAITNSPANGYALRYTNGVFYWAP